MKKKLILLSLAWMFLFPMNGQAAEPLFSELDGVGVGYDNGFLLRVKDKFQLKFEAFLQFQYFYEDKDDPTQQNTSTFKIAKGRLRWIGFIHNPNIAYIAQLEVANGSTNKNVTLKDFAIELKHYPHAKFRIGQFFIPFNRQQTTFFAVLQFVDTSLAAKAFNANQVNPRDIGIQMSGSYYDHRLQYYTGIFNGNGINSNNDTSKFLTTGRIIYSPFGKMPNSESDMAYSENALLSIGTGYVYDAGNNDPVKDPATVNRSSVETFALEFAYKFKGLSAQGEYYLREDKLNPDMDGFYLQTGYFLIPHHIEFSARYSQVDSDAVNSDQTEATVGLNFFFNGHRHKLQIDGSAIKKEDPTPNSKDFNKKRVRLQYQFSF